ncbi:MAG: hypothetical protein EKK39_02230 [Sphingobacteriales bacterium]|uniref:hypothetical protein n=1 Tax=Hydrotalea flava TaxID=714549 RepID=UPI000832FE9C|nr:hypothetical protein [Hydrotalea flava]RTL55824.1 MAG: hypothetical protein EKK39_02230 [Sphingobacteriales bacterium]
MKKNIVLIFGSFIVVLLIVVFLINFKTNQSKHFLQYGGFERKKINIAELTLIQNVNLFNGNYKILGYYNKQIYLQSFTTNTIYRFSESRPAIENSTIYINEIFKTPISVSSISIDARNGIIYIFSEAAHTIYTYDIASHATNEIKTNFLFNRGWKLNDVDFIFETESKQNINKDFVFTFLKYKKDLNQNIIYQKVDTSNLFLIDMVDDGILNISGNSKLVYTCFYKNSIFVLDSNLKVSLKGKLIDTISNGPIVTFIGTNGTGRLQYASPVRMSNPNAQVLNNKLFNHSLVAANNDGDFKGNIVLDVYNISNVLNYDGSYYIPKLDGDNLNDFFILENKIFLVYSKNLFIYESKYNF